MNRRTFLQSVIAVPLAAVAMPRVLPVYATSDSHVLLTSGGRGYLFDQAVFDHETGISMRFVRSWDRLDSL